MISIGGTAALEFLPIGGESHPSIINKISVFSFFPGEGLFCKIVTKREIKKMMQ